MAEWHRGFFPQRTVGVSMAVVVAIGPLLGAMAATSATAQGAAAPAVSPQGDLTLALGGDTMLARLVGRAILRRGPSYPWGDVRELLQQADLTVVNLECVIADGGRPFLPERVFYFRAPPPAVETLTSAGIDCVSLANNHAMDYRGEALSECLARLDEAAVAHAGAGRDLGAAERFAVIERGGVRVAVLACADHFREYAATRSRPGTKVIRVSTEGEDFEWIRSQIASARKAGADVVVFSIHWGPNMREQPPPGFVRFAHAVMDAGADIFHGHSAHVFQGIEIYRGKPIFYDTGELVDDYAVDPVLRNDQALLYLVTLEGTQVRRIELVPLAISDMQVNQATGKLAEDIALQLRRRSARFGTTYQQHGRRLSVLLPGE